eukprot:15329563-Alexandrium_andersonii.AAC.1
MSASLVGSEMCIRDSYSGLKRALSKCCCPTGSARHELFGNNELRVVPVSYTHLTLPTICSV